MIRDAKESDRQAIEEMFLTSHLPENCRPDLASPLFIIKKVVDENGKAVQVGAVRITAEVFLLVDHDSGTPEKRMSNLKELSEEMAREAWQKGLDDVTAWIPPEIEKSFGKRLKEIGFQRSPWPSYSRILT